MGDYASLNGQRVVSANIVIPYWGSWVADVVLAVSTALPTGPVTLTLADASLVGTIYRQFSFSGARSARIVGGFGGWQKTVASRPYQNASGVPLMTVLGDLASDCGEVIDPVSVAAAAGQTVGAFFVRESAPAIRTLRQILPVANGQSVWWIDSTGNTQVIDRAGVDFMGVTSGLNAKLGPILSQFNALDYSGGKGLFKIATESVSDWMPGRTFSSATVTVSQTISMVTHILEGDGKLRTQVLSTA